MDPALEEFSREREPGKQTVTVLPGTLIRFEQGAPRVL